MAGYETLLADFPKHAQALHFSALILHEIGRHADAAQRIERSLAIDDHSPDPWSNLALVYSALGRSAEAMRALEAALQRDAMLAEVWINLASMRLAANDAAGAEDAARQAIACGTGQGAWFNLALSLAAQQKKDEALEAARAAARLASDDPAPFGLQAQLLAALGRRAEALAILDEFLAKREDFSLRLERARLVEVMGDITAALADYRKLIANSNHDDATLSEFIFLKKRVCDWAGLPELQARFREALGTNKSDASELTPFSFLSDPSSRAEQKQAARAWARRYRQRPAGADAARRAISEYRLRIGYLSADLHEHATGVLTAGLFESHDRSAFEIFGYSTGIDDGSALRARLVAGFDHFLDARGFTAERLAERIRDDRIDIFVDLKGYTDDAPTAVVALRPAPIQVNYLGYPGTMGADFIDYLIGDAIVTPLEHAADYSETLVLLPASYQINDDRRAIGIAPPRSTLGLPEGAFVLCCFNNGYKIGPEVFDAWMQILRSVPKAVLWLLARNRDAPMIANLRAEAERRGVAPERIVFAASRPNAEYLALYGRADLFLDTWPYNAHTTASDALWAGCPLLTLLGETFAGRVAASLLNAVAMPELIMQSVEAYVCEAIALASEKKRLEGLRARLKRDARASPLFDTSATTRAIERAYAQMALQYRAGICKPIVLTTGLSSSRMRGPSGVC